VVRARPFAGEGDLRLMQQLVAECWRLERPVSHFHVGDLAWGRYQHVGREREWRIRLWETSDGEPVAWGWIHLPDELDFQAHPRLRRTVIPEILDWFEAEVDRYGGADRLVVGALEGDAATTEALVAAGFRASGSGAFDLMVLELGGGLADEPSLPPGFRARHVRGEEDLAPRVAVHRAAFSDRQPSRVTAVSYANVMAAWPYRRELDWVVEAPDGRFVSFCLAWLDDRNGVGELEPVGTDPAFRRRGFGRAACAAALRALKEHGAGTALVYAAEVPGWPPAPALYRSLGFEPAGRHVVFTRERD
jgi:ribosomal protein S18 acetylase RimI-like enzyme